MENKLTRRQFLGTALLSAAGVGLAACVPKNLSAEPLSDDERNFLGIIKKSEQYFNDQIRVTSNAGVDLSKHLEVVIPKDFREFNVPALENPEVILPITTINSALLAAIPTFVEYTESGAVIKWLELFHWVNHAPEANKSIFDLVGYFRFLNTIVQAGLNGTGQIIHRPEQTINGKVLKEAYIFITDINSHSWAAILSGDGGLITGYNTSLNGGKFNPTKADRFKTNQLKTGKFINPSELPDVFRKTWGNPDRPPFFRSIVENFKYDAKVALELNKAQFIEGLQNFPEYMRQNVASLQIFFTILSHSPVLMAPADMLLCGGGNDMVLPGCYQEPSKQ